MTESVTIRLGARLAEILRPGDVVFLDGDLGAGKSTLARAILRAMGWTGSVRSPSYALVHAYATVRGKVNHLDLYRIGSMDEALGLDLDQLSESDSISLVEWPDRLGGSLNPTWRVHLEIDGDGRNLDLRGPHRPGFESILAHLNQENDS
jgi:tRNA threonylcarbamoyladenosine biosynthesis protein TsaE